MRILVFSIILLYLPSVFGKEITVDEFLNSCKVVKLARTLKQAVHVKYENYELEAIEETYMPTVRAGYRTNEVTQNGSRYRLSLRGKPYNYWKAKDQIGELESRLKKEEYFAEESSNSVYNQYLNQLIELRYLDLVAPKYAKLKAKLDKQDFKKQLKNLSRTQMMKFNKKFDVFQKSIYLQERRDTLAKSFEKCAIKIKNTLDITFPEIDKKFLLDIASRNTYTKTPIYKRCKEEEKLLHYYTDSVKWYKLPKLTYNYSRVMPEGETAFNEFQIGVEFSIPWGKRAVSNTNFTNCHKDLYKDIHERFADRAYFKGASQFIGIMTTQALKYNKMIKSAFKAFSINALSLDDLSNLIELYDQSVYRIMDIQKKSYKYLLEKSPSANDKI